ncbi:hypothetical protein L7F22_058568 [Adiantum nelumboides]|nr:hypothetical protein [Adiantum nelumboides]
MQQQQTLQQLYEQSMEDNGIQGREAVDGFDLIVVPKQRTRIAELQTQQGVNWQEFKKALKKEYFLKDSQKVTKQSFMKWIKQKNKDVSARELLHELEKKYDQLFATEQQSIREEGSSSQDGQPISTVDEVGEGSIQAKEAFRMRLVNDVTLFKHLMEKPRFMEFLQSPLMPQQVREHPQLSEHVEAQFQVLTVSQKSQEHSHVVESKETLKQNLSVHQQVVTTPVLQAISDRPATLKRPNAGSNRLDIMFWDMHPVLPPSIA